MEIFCEVLEGERVIGVLFPIYERVVLRVAALGGSYPPLETLMAFLGGEDDPLRPAICCTGGSK